MKIIFLDIDGVVNGLDTKERINGIIGVEQSKIELIKQIVDATGAKIVLSSTWRIDWFYEGQPGHESGTIEWHYLRDEFAKQGLSFLDHTPLHKTRHRGIEIQQWLDDTEYDVETYCIIDDNMYEIHDMHKGHLVKTAYADGIKPGAVKIAIEILNKIDKNQGE